MLPTKINGALIPMLSPFYKDNFDSEFIQSILGIANVKYRRDFYTLNRIISSIDDFNGNVIECGTYKGCTLLGMANLLKKRGKIDVKIYGLDSFEGFPDPTKEDACSDGTFHDVAWKGYYKDASYSELVKRIDALGFSNQITLLKGFFEDTLPRLKNEKFKLVHLDCDLYQSYKTCLESLYDKVLPGGYFVFDDYLSTSVYPGAQRAVDEFFKDKPEKVQFFNDKNSTDSNSIGHRRALLQKSS